MLIINSHTLKTVNVLDLVNNILLNSGRTHDGENIARSYTTIRKRSTSTYSIMFLYQDLLRKRYKILLLIACLRCHDDLTITTLYLTHSYLTIDFRYNSRVRRVTSLKKLSYTRETTSDITCTTYSTRNLNQNLTGINCLSILNSQVTTYREVVCTKDFTISINNITRWNHCLILGIGDNLLLQACSLIDLSTISLILLNVIELQCTGILADDNGVEWIPTGDNSILLYDFTLLVIQ